MNNMRQLYFGPRANLPAKIRCVVELCMKYTLSVCATFACLAAFADTEFNTGSWKVSFADEGARLTLSHKEGNAELFGCLSFAGPAAVTGAGRGADSSTARWRVASSRDGFPNRLALVDTRDNVNGYITFQPDGEGVSLLVYHRTAFAYAGTLAFQGEVRYRDDAYPCSVTPKKGDRVLSVKSGPAVSLGDDALFSPSADEALALKGMKLKLESGKLSASAELRIDDATQNAFSLKIVKDWYKSRWVPNWRAPDRRRSPHAPTGWLSWNTYFDQAGSKENLDEARFAAKWFKPFGMEIWNIESWQDNSPKLPVSNFHNMNLETYKVQFPEGMKWLADEIRKLGFRPGLWMAPYGTGNDKFYAEHKDWFLHDKDGKPIRSWNGKYTLDPTAPGALEHLTSIFDRASHEWGYEFFKIDGMSGRGPGYCAHLYERPEIRAVMHDPNCPNPFERTVAAYRKGIGDDRIFLACQGHFTGAEAGYADASRTGADIVHPNEPVKWENILLQARCTVNQFFAHANVFWSDPDCMLVSQAALAREQAQVEATVVALPGQQTFAGDKLAELAPDRVRLIQQALPVCPTRPGKLYPMFGHLPVWDLHVSRPFGDWHVVALFNWSDEEKEVSVAWDELGEDPDRRFVAWEFWTETYFGDKKGSLSAAVPPRGVRLFALQPLAGHPQFLTSDRHLTQGAVELLGQKWDGSRLVAKIAAVGGFPQVVRFAVPKGWELKSATADGVDVKTKEECDGMVVAVELSAPRSCDVDLRLDF